MTDRPYRVLFLCTGNSARSILAEAMLDHLGRGRFKACSAGSHPTGRVNPLSLETLAEMGIALPAARSKSWEEFAGPGAEPIDFVITVCDSAAGETCPIWPGRPVSAHWGVADPAAVVGNDERKRESFRDAARILRRRIEALTALPLESLDRGEVERQLRAIGRT